MPGLLRDASVVVEDPAEGSTLHNKGSFGAPRSGGGLALTLLEAVYLVETDRLEVRDADGPVALRELFRLANARVTAFEIRYLVYRDLRQRGYVVEEGTPPIDFRVYPRGGGPKATPSKWAVSAISERGVFDLDALEGHLRRVAGARKNLVLAVVDEESDVTYYAVRHVAPRGRSQAAPSGPAVAHLLADRATVLDEEDAARLHAGGFHGKFVGRRLQLSLLETVHLMGVGAIEVRRADTGRKVSPGAVRSQARKLQPDFDLRLRAYEDLKARGIVVKTGFKYGSHFRAYEGDPDRTHAKYLVHALPAAHRGMWPEVSRAVRLAHGVKKHLLLAAVADAEVRYLSLERMRP